MNSFPLAHSASSKEENVHSGFPSCGMMITPTELAPTSADIHSFIKLQMASERYERKVSLKRNEMVPPSA